MIFNAPTFNIFNISKSHGHSLVGKCLSNINDCLDSSPSSANTRILILLIFSAVGSFCLLLCVWRPCGAWVPWCTCGSQKTLVKSLLLPSSCGFWDQTRSSDPHSQQFTCWHIAGSVSASFRFSLFIHSFNVFQFCFNFFLGPWVGHLEY